MATMTIRLSDEKHRRLQQMAASQGVSLNRLVDELSSVALAQYDAELRFQALARKGEPAQGLRLVDKLGRALAGKPKRK